MRTPKTSARSQKRPIKGREFFVVRYDHNGFSNIEFENPEESLPDCCRLGFAPPLRHIQELSSYFKVAPSFAAGGTNNRFLKDVDTYGGYWLVSDRAKTVFKSIDPAGFQFGSCVVRNRKTGERPTYWICGIARNLDAINDHHSTISPEDRGDGLKFYRLIGFDRNSHVSMNFDAVGDAHIFHLNTQLTIICDEVFRHYYKEADLSGLRFALLP